MNDEKRGRMRISQIYDLVKKIGIIGFIEMLKASKEASKYARSYMTFYCVSCLSNIGFLEKIQKEKEVNLKQFCEGQKLNITILSSICKYLYALKILDIKDNKIRLSKKGQALINHTLGTLDFLYAYAPVFENLEMLATGNAKYGVDVFRRGYHVAKATAEVSKYIPIPVVKDIIHRYKFESVLDLGCGSADFLISISDKTVNKCYGMDISEDAIKLAKVKIESIQKQGRIFACRGDIFNPDDLKNFPEDINVITCMFVLHEYFDESYDKIVSWLKLIHRIFPQQKLLICELMRFSPQQLRANPISIAEHHLFHDLSNQGILTINDCYEIFKKAGYKIIEEVRYDFAGQAYFLLG